MLQSLEELLNKIPFEPFRIVLTSGSMIEVTDPHLVAMGQSQITVYYPRSDRWAMLRVNQIAAFEALEAA
ncbi:MAG: hypothetical protein WD768_16970 [Phycisphaeraceae bacterium]